MTSGRLMATAKATACEPSHCLSMVGLPFCGVLFDYFVGLPSRILVALRDRTLEFLTDGRLHGVERDESSRSGEGTQLRHVGYRAPDVFDGQFGRADGQ